MTPRIASSKRLALLAWGALLVLFFPAGNLPWFRGLPLANAAQFGGLLLLVPLLVSRWVRTATADRAGGLSSRRTLLVIAVLLVTLVAKVSLLLTGGHAGWSACYHPVGKPQVASGCERSYDNAFFLERATRFDPAVDFGSSPGEPPIGKLSDSNWNLGFFNSLRWNVWRPADYREHLPFSVVWTATATARGRVSVTYVGQGSLRTNRVYQLPPAYESPRSFVLAGLPRGPSRVVIRFRFSPPKAIRERSSYAMIRVTGLTLPAPTEVETVLRWLIDLPLLALFAAIAFAYARIAKREQWILLAAVAPVMAFPILGITHNPQAPTLAGVIVVLGAVVLRPSRRMVLFGVWTVVLINVICVGASTDWHAVVYRSGGNDFLAYESQARSILDTGSLRGGESVFWEPPAIRYIVFGLRVLVGDGDALFFVMLNSLVTLGIILTVAITASAVRHRSLARALTLALGMSVLVMLSTGDVLGYLHAGMAEWPVYAGLPLGTALLIQPRNRRWLLAGTFALGVCVVSRPEVLPAAAFILAVALMRGTVKDSRGAIACGVLFACMALLPLGHNLIYGHTVTFFIRDVPANEQLSPTALLHIFSNGHVQQLVGTQVRGIVYAAAKFSSPLLVLVIRFLQASWLLCLVGIACYWRRSSWTSRLLVIAPLLSFAPFLIYDVYNYYPRHILAGYILIATGVLLVLAMNDIPEPSLPAVGRLLPYRTSAAFASLRGAISTNPGHVKTSGAESTHRRFTHQGRLEEAAEEAPGGS